ncbi:hypothetical protein TSAR_007778 [Trichomalopsis sarcophagae]|uniref:Uncharacterized protein n=1 Tax=Trichomalopsis sarcophagae TaxID=543379 RepID=A0A232FKE6_9HYME|nr:hypothetical protein TSAR_007778 [Trichomalopsis sarcophagae]
MSDYSICLAHQIGCGDCGRDNYVTIGHRSYIETLLSYGPAAKNSLLSSVLWYDDTAGKMDNTDADPDSAYAVYITKAKLFVILGQLPKRIKIGFIENKAYNIHKKPNPFNLKNLKIKIPSKPLQPDFKRGSVRIDVRFDDALDTVVNCIINAAYDNLLSLFEKPNKTIYQYKLCASRYASLELCRQTENLI